MDVARTIGALREQSPEQWLRAANRYLPPLVTGALVLLIAYQLAELTWIVTPDGTYDRPLPAVAEPSGRDASADPAADLSVLTRAHLFGEAPAEGPAMAVPAQLDAPDTTLNVRLTGLIASEGPDAGYAFIESGGDQQKQYEIGQPIDGGSGATLHAVYIDRVILNRGGQLETLRLPKELAGSASPAPARLAPVIQPDDSLRSLISENATDLTHIMRLQPAVEGGQMVGFRVNPGRDRETFEALGLQPGDVVTDINGTVLDDPSKALQVFEALGESTMANVTIMRDGTPTVVVIDTTQLQSLAEDRQ